MIWGLRRKIGGRPPPETKSWLRPWTRRQSKTFLRGYEQCLGKVRGHGHCWFHLATVWDEDQSAERRFSPFGLEGPPQRKGEARAEQDRQTVPLHSDTYQ